MKEEATEYVNNIKKDYERKSVVREKTLKTAIADAYKRKADGFFMYYASDNKIERTSFLLSTSFTKNIEIMKNIEAINMFCFVGWQGTKEFDNFVKDDNIWNKTQKKFVQERIVNKDGLYTDMENLFGVEEMSKHFTTTEMSLMRAIENKVE